MQSLEVAEVPIGSYLDIYVYKSRLYNVEVFSFSFTFLGASSKQL